MMRYTVRLSLSCARFLAIAWLVAGARCGAADESILRLTNSGTEKRDLVFFDADTLVYCEQVTPKQLALMRLSLSTGVVERLHPKFETNEFEAAFSPEGRYSAFVQNTGNLNLRLIIRDGESDTEADFQQGGFSGMRSPCFTADGQRLLYAYPEDARQPIWSCDLHCGDRRKVVDSSGINNWPSVTPDGATIVFGSTRDGNFEIYACDATGGNVRRLTDEPRQDIRPRVSPDGKRIAFTSNRDGNYEIYVMALDGSEVQRVTNYPERDDYVAWHPDGRLAWVEERGGKFDIVLEATQP